MIRRMIIYMAMILGVIFCNCEERKGESYIYLKQAPIEVKEVRKIPIYMDIGFTTGEGESIKLALGQWEATLNGYVRIDVVDESFNMEIEKIEEARRVGGKLIMKIGAYSNLIKEEAGKRTYGFTNAIGGDKVYIIMENIPKGEEYGVVLHEFGHIMGAEHSHGLMGATYNLGMMACIDYEAVIQVGRYNGWDSSKMNYCIKKK